MRARLNLIAIAVLAILGLGTDPSAGNAATATGTDASTRPPTWMPAAVNDTGIVIWRTQGSTIPQMSVWDGAAFGAQQPTADVGEWRIIAGAASPTRDEYIVLGVDIDGVITGQMYSSGAWSALPFNPLDTVTESFWWGFDVAYEQVSGDAMVIWNNRIGGFNGLSYRVWNGTVWSAETPTATFNSDEPQHMHLVAKPGADEMVLVVSSDNSQDYALVWDGSAWGDMMGLTSSSTGDDRTDIAVAYETQSGRAMVCYGDEATAVYHYIWDGSDWSDRDSAVVAAGLTGDARWTTLASDPQSDRIALGVLTTNSEIWLNVWDGSAWETSLVASMTATGTVFPGVAVAFEGLSGEAVAAYGEAASVRYRTWTAGGGWSAEGDASNIGAAPNSITLDGSPTDDEIMLVSNDSNNDLNYVLWDGSAWGSRMELEKESDETKNQPFLFLWQLPTVISNTPVLAAIGAQSVDENQNLNFGISATDPDGDSLILSAENLPTNATFTDDFDGTGTFDFNPDFTQSGSYSVRFIVSDGVLTDTEIVVITVNNVNRDPVLAAIGAQSVDENQNLNFGISATDPDGDSLILYAENLPTNATFTDNFDGTGTFDFNPDFTQAGSYSVRFIASDGVLTDTEIVVITVNNVNRDPVLAAIGAQSVDENQNLNFGISATDPDGDSLILSAENLPTNATFTDDFDGTGTFDFDPDFTQSGSHTVRFIASDGVLADTEIVVITVNNVNRPPVLDAIGGQGTDEGQSLNFTVTASDPDGTVPALAAEDLPLNATFVDHGDGTGTLDFTPNFEQQGGYGITFIASDGVLADTESVTVTVNGVNRAPVLGLTSAQSVTAGHNLNFTVSAVDPDGDSLTLSAENLPANATFVDGYDDTGSFDFDPGCDQDSTYDVRFIAEDAVLADTLVVTITVNPFTVATIAVTPATGVVVEGTTVAFTATGLAADLSCSLDLTDSVTWSTTDPSGSITSGGVYTAGTDLSPPDYFIRAAYGGLIDSGQVTVISDGLLANIRIEWPDGTDFGDTTLTTDNDTVQPVCRAYDSGDNLIGDIAVTWSVIGVDAIGTVVAGPIAQTELTLTTVGTGRMVAYYSASIVDTSGLITCTAGVPAHIVIAPDTGTVTADSTLQFSAETYDADGNPAAAVTIDSWDVIGDIGSISAAGLFSPGTAGVGLITAIGGGLADTTDTITVLPGRIQTITVSPDSAEVSADSTLQFTVAALDGKGNATDPGTITWSFTEPVGTIDAAGLFEPTTAGVARVVAVSNLGPTDTTAHLEVIAGTLATLAVTPDSVAVTVGESRTFTVTGSDADGNAVDPGTVTWAVVGDVGTIDAAGVFTAMVSGIGRIAAASADADVADTNRAVVVYPTDLTRLIVSPDTGSVSLGSSLGFIATGYTPEFEVVDAGWVTWEVLGGIGTIDTDGNFTATTRGTGRIAATRTVDGVSDTSGMIVVDILTAENVPLGNQFVHAGEAAAPIMAFTIENRFATAKGIVGLTLHDLSRGFGTTSQIRSNIDSVLLYIDSDLNGAVGPSDLRLAAVAPVDATIDLDFATVTISPFSRRQLLAAIRVSDTPCDGDSLDVYLLPTADVRTLDGSIVGGADSLNSLGRDIIDGLIADQMSLRSPATTTVTSGGGFQHVLSLDVPRNGYREDTLRILALTNAGTATESDLDSVAVFLDDGDGVWDEADRVLFAGAMLFTGGQWEISGAAIRLAQPATVLHVAVVPSSFATDGRTLALGVPLHGMEMFSANDGPIDVPIPPAATVTIVTSGAVEVDIVPIAGRTLIPGAHSRPILGLSLVNNSGTDADLDSLRLTFASDEPQATAQALLDGQIDSVMLWLKRDTDYSRLGVDDSLIAVCSIDNGAAALDLRTLRIAAGGGRAALTATVALNLTDSKNGNRIGLRLTAAADLFFSAAVLVSGDFPLENTGVFTVDAFPAAAMTVNAMAGRTLFSGQNAQVVLDFTLPRNGYAGDYLSRLRLVNWGTSEGKGALARTVLWADAGDDGFTPDDIRLGDLTHLDGAWEIAGLAYPLVAPATRCLVTVDISQTSFEGGSLQLAVPSGGVTFASETTGPDDAAVMDAETHLIFPASRITAISIPQLHTPIAPGSVGDALMTFALYNGYVEAGKTLQALTLTNRSHSRSAAEYADHELGQISLFADTNGNRVLDNDLLLASGHLSDGALRLTGLSVGLPPESLSYLFVTADVALEAIDGDSLAVCIESYADLEFNEAVNINGDVPITGTGMLIVDGSVSAQYTLTADPPAVLSPDDSGVVLLGFRPAVNGDLDDTLRTVSVTDVVAAGGNVIASLALWRDADNDGALGPLDEYLGTFTAQSGTWVVDGLSLPVTQPAPGLLVVGVIASEAEAGASVRLAVPVMGCRYVSNNDGPRDRELMSPAASVVSTAALRVAMPDLNATYTIGQMIAVPVAVTNVSLAAIDDVVPAVVMLSGDTCVTFDSARTSGLTISPGETAVFGYHYTAACPGSVAWSLRAVSTATGDSSVMLHTPAVAVQSRPDYARVRLINSMPPAVTRGQANVFPMTIAIGHPDTAATAAPLRLDRLVIHACDGDAQDIPLNSVASRLALATGLPNLTVIEDVPAEASVALVFPQPLLVAPGRQRLLSLLIDIPEDAALVDFHLGLAGPGGVPLTDANTLEPVLLDPGIVFPLRTAGCHIHDAAQQLAVSSRSLVGSTLNFGQREVAVLQLNVRHPAEVGSSRIQLSSVACEFVDAAGAVIPPAGLCDAVQVRRGSFVLGTAGNIPADSLRVHVALSSPLVLNADQSDSVRIVVSLKAESSVSGFSIIIRDSTAFAVRDVSSGTLLETVSDPTALPLGAVFPMLSDFALLKEPASGVDVCFTSAIPTSIVGGQDAIALVAMTCTYAAPAGYSAINIGSIRVAVQDSDAVRLDPRALLDRVGYRVGGGTVSYQSFFSLDQGSAVFELGEGGIQLDPGDSVTIELMADIESDAPYDHFVLAIFDVESVSLSDVSDTTRDPGMRPRPECVGWLPVYSPTVSLFQPAGRPVIVPSATGARVTYGGEQDVAVFAATIDYDPPTRQGNVLLRSLRADLRSRAAEGDTALPVDAVFDGLRLLVDDVAFGVFDALPTDGIEFLLGEECVLRHGMHHTLTISGDLKADAPPGNYFLHFEDASFVGMIDEQLRTAVVPVLEGTTYPFDGPDLAISSAGLGNSFSNYPNPFNPARGEVTTIAYVLGQDATVDIEIFTITGQQVITITDDAPRTAGAHQVDIWTGVNDASFMVMPGTYFCRITARYASGSVEQHRRKIAVVR